MKKVWLVTMVLLLGASACSTRQSGPETAVERTTVQVDNQNFLDMSIFVLERGRRVRLGDVPGLSSRTFVIPDRLLFGVASLQFQADPVGAGRTPPSQEIAVTRGDALRLTIQPF